MTKTKRRKINPFICDHSNEQLFLFVHPFSVGFEPGDRVEIIGPSRFENGPSSGFGTVLYNPYCTPPDVSVFADNSDERPAADWFGYAPENLRKLGKR